MTGILFGPTTRASSWVLTSSSPKPTTAHHISQTLLPSPEPRSPTSATRIKSSMTSANQGATTQRPNSKASSCAISESCSKPRPEPSSPRLLIRTRTASGPMTAPPPTLKPSWAKSGLVRSSSLPTRRRKALLSTHSWQRRQLHYDGQAVLPLVAATLSSLPVLSHRSMGSLSGFYFRSSRSGLSVISETAW